MQIMGEIWINSLQRTDYIMNLKYTDISHKSLFPINASSKKSLSELEQSHRII